MILLMFQSTRSLFTKHEITGDSAHIDVVVRTSIAAIFGYFLSANFIRRTFDGSSNNTGGTMDSTKLISAETGGAQGRIGFSSPQSGMDADTPDIGGASYTENSSPHSTEANKLQIIITSVIGLFCLAVLILARDISALNADMEMSASAAATITQFRDFISGCIGFLIGCPTTAANK